MKNRAQWIWFYGLVILCFFAVVHLGNRSVTVIAENRPLQHRHCIVIDAGHGGIDGGATSCTGKLESVFNLEISLRLNDLFQLLGYDTRMIRTTDTSVYTQGETIAQQKVSDLKERVRIANETANALLISIHQNNFSDGKYSGAQVFYGSEEGSEPLSKQLQSSIINTLNPGSRRQCKPAKGIYLMEHINCPGILIECGFLSNPAEEAMLQSADYQKALCTVIAANVSTYLSNT